MVEGPVGGDAERAAFVGGGDEAEQQLGAGVVEGGEADFVDDDQVVAEQGVDDLARRCCRPARGRGSRPARRR